MITVNILFVEKCKFSINYGFGSISPFDTSELIETLLRNQKAI